MRRAPRPERLCTASIHVRCHVLSCLLPFAWVSQSPIEEFGGGAELGKYEEDVRSKNYES